MPAEGMILGEAPGYREDNVEIPFSGKSGILLRRTLRDLGVDPRNLYITNTVACRPPGNRAPTRAETKICSSTYLDEQIRRVNPRVVLVLGNTALSYVLGRKGTITKAEGTSIKKGAITYIPSRHPSSIVRAEGTDGYDFVMQKFRENLLLFKRVLFPTEDNFEFVDRFPDPGEIPDGPIIVDIETNGLNPFKIGARIWCMSIQHYLGGPVFCFRVASPTKIQQAIAEGKELRVKRLLEEHEIIVQRGTFEGTWLLTQFGVLPHLYFDVKLGSFLIDENEQSGLKYQAIKCLGVEPWVEEQDWRNPDFDTLLLYNARDTLYEGRLYRERDLPHLKKHPKQAKLLKYILLPAQEIFTEVICRGFHIDMDQAAEKLILTQERQEEYRGKIAEHAGYAINPGSPKQLIKLLYRDLGLKCPVKTKKGAESTGEAALIRLAGKHIVVDDILEWRKWKKYDSTYLTPWINKGPILHAQYGFTNTATGRLNSTMTKDSRGEKNLGATLHQCPRDGFIRNLIKARDPESIIVAADLSQIELRLVAHESRDRTMTSIFNSGEDIHTSTAATLVRGEIDKETRKKAKAVNFGFVYGMFPPKFQRYAKEKFGLDLTIEQCKRYRDAFFNKYFDLEAWYRRVEAQVGNNGWIDSVFGRRRHLPQARLGAEVEEWVRRESIRQAINSPIQSAGSDLCLFIASLILSPRLLWDFKVDRSKAFLVGSAHDSQIYECKRDYYPQLKSGIEWTLANLPTEKYFGFKFRVPILMDVVGYEDHWEGIKIEG